MKITSGLFETYLKCPMKCWLRATGEPGTGHPYSEWVKSQEKSFRVTETDRLCAESLDGESARALCPDRLKTGKWRLGIDVMVVTPNLPRISRRKEARTSVVHQSTLSSQPSNQSLVISAAPSDGEDSPSAIHGPQFVLESLLHAVERLPFGRGRSAQIIPIRFVFFNKLSEDDRLLLAFDAWVLSAALGREIAVGKIIHGDDHAALKVKTAALAGDVRRRLQKIAALFSGASPPDLVLNRHCAECEFQPRCRQKALETDDLSLLAGMSAKERHNLRSKGIFSITQLSYTFRPRRRPKRIRDKREKYHHSLKALAIREKKVHIVGRPALTIEGTPVYLDVEGVPDLDFYYLIGVRVGHGNSAVQRSLWADTVEDEGTIWREFLGILESIEKPVLIHYGSYETTCLRQMRKRYGTPPEGSVAAATMKAAVNLLSVIFAQVYYPCHSNGLKDIATHLGFRWSDSTATGIGTIAWRHEWKSSRAAAVKQALLTYNVEDCQALEVIADSLRTLQCGSPQADDASSGGVVDTAQIKWEHPYGFKRNTFAFRELEAINNAAYWDYQRERVYVKSNRILKRPVSRPGISNRMLPPNTTVECGRARACPKCNATHFFGHGKVSKTVLDLRFMRNGVKRWIVRYCFHRYKCQACGTTFSPEDRRWTRSPFGSELTAYALYLTIELRLPQIQVDHMLNKLFGFHLTIGGTTHGIKERAAKLYRGTYEALLTRLCQGRLLHADETKISIRGKEGFVWVFASMEEVAYVYSETREGDLLQSMLKNFRGVLVSDFYAAYDAIPCPQQKCLIHLIRDLNDDVLAHPYDQDMKRIALAFTALLKPMVETIDRYGLKVHFLKTHLAAVTRFYKQIATMPLHSDTAAKFKERFEKNRNTLFTFLSFDGVPWNNNNAEHGVKSFAALRRVIDGVTSERGIRDYLVLFSLCETCKYMGVDFLDFLRSGQKDVHAFAESRRGRRRPSPTANGT
jgi:predicted RecB family nuclease